VAAAVSVVLSDGSASVTVPTAQGQNLGNAIGALQTARLKVGLATVKVAATVAGGTKPNPALGVVLSQTPAAGSAAKVGDTVTLTYGAP